MSMHEEHGHGRHVAGEHHHGPGVREYLIVFAGLSVLTLVSFIANWMARHGTITAHQSFAIILGVAVVKAALVGLFFMHLLADWRRLYFLLIPAFILGCMMMVVLMPDIVLAWRM